MHINPSTNNTIHSLNGDVIEKFNDFLYLGGYTNTARNINTHVAKAWGALNSLARVWCSRTKPLTKITPFPIYGRVNLLYRCEFWAMTKALIKKVDGTYTRMLRRVKNVT